MERELFDKKMNQWGWIPHGKEDMPLLATTAAQDKSLDWQKVNEAYKYCHKSGFTICVDDNEIAKVTDDSFEDWLEETSLPYIQSRMSDYCWGERNKTDVGEYLHINTFSEMWVDAQIKRLTGNDYYILQKKGKEFSFRKWRSVYTATFFKPKPI